MRSEEQFGWRGRPAPWAPGMSPLGMHPGLATAMAGAHGGGDEGEEEHGWRGARFGGPGFGGPGFGGAAFGGPPGWGGRGGRGRGGGPGGRGGRARRGDVRAAVLLLLAETPRNGYQIIQELDERSHGAWRPSPGSVYPVLQQLEDEGLVVSTTADVGRLYRITEAGTAYIEAHRADMGVPWEEAANAVSPPAKELAMVIPQVIGAIKQVLHAGTDRQITQAAAVLSDTRRALYRILAEDAPSAPASGPAPAPDEGSDA
jgi:DNA-binding PadR family transcriptional regulator